MSHIERLQLVVLGEPRGWQRGRPIGRVVYQDGKPRAVVSVHTPPETRRAEREIRDLFAATFPRHVPWTRGVMLKFVAVFAIPPSWPKHLREAARRGTLYHTGKPDKDNVEKLILDSLKGLAWVDDAQMQGGGVKRYGYPPRIEVTLEPLDQPDVPATPGQRRVERASQAERDGHAPIPLHGKPNKSKTPRLPPEDTGLGRALRAAVERDARRGRT